MEKKLCVFAVLLFVYYPFNYSMLSMIKIDYSSNFSGQIVTPGLHSLQKNATNYIPHLVGASLAMLRTNDRNRSALDHLRRFCVGGLLGGGLWEFAQNCASHNLKESVAALGMIAVGSLLLSQQDIKTFLGLQRGHSLNPPADLKAYIKKNRELAERKVQIRGICLDIAHEGKRQALPFIYRIGAAILQTLKNKETDLRKKSVYITTEKLVTEILPNLRTDVELLAIPKENYSLTVYSVDHDTSAWLDKDLIDGYLSLEDFKKTNKIKS